MKTFLLSALSAVLLGFSPLAASATTVLGNAVLLSDLLNGGTLQVGDKRFDGFSYSATGDMPIANLVNVIPIQNDADGSFGIRIQGAFLDLASSQGGSDALIGFTVTAMDPALEIVGVTIVGNPTQIGSAGAISVVETFDFDPNARLVIFDDENDINSVDAIQFAGLRKIQILKDISAISTTPGGMNTVTLSFVDQFFTQAGVVPEPASAVLMVLGLGLLAARRRSS